jgi:hypothetical protein
MNTSRMRKKIYLLSFVGMAVVSSLLMGCNQSGTESSVDSSYYTRGIGQYPGAPNENFAPRLSDSDKSYRNIALHREAFTSSSHDYNLTAQLATDGIITDKQPQYLILSSQNGEYPRREMEWMIDE